MAKTTAPSTTTWVLKDAGRISAEIAKEHAEGEFGKYRVIQDRLFRSDSVAFAALEIEK